MDTEEKNGAEAQPQDRDADLEAEESPGKEASKPQESGELSKLRAEANDYKDKYLRALAEFENYKKRALKDRADLLKYQGERILADLLEVVDNLERALTEAKADPSHLQEGLTLIHKLFLDILARWEIKQESALGANFDPSKHRAVSQVQLDDAVPGTVVSELRKAYFYRDRLLRAAEVAVAAAREAPPQDSQDPTSSDEGGGEE